LFNSPSPKGKEEEKRGGPPSSKSIRMKKMPIKEDRGKERKRGGSFSGAIWREKKRKK